VDIRWLAVPFLLLVIVIALKRWWTGLWRGLKIAFKWSLGILTDARTCEVAKTCCGEVAVLLLVFPAVDTLYDHKHLSDPILHGSIETGLLFFLFAILLAHAEKPENKDKGN
jgi:hypothetical protein